MSMPAEPTGKTESAWEALFEKHDIAARVRQDGVFKISAEQIKEFREPRLMAKFDHKKNLPAIFRNNKLGILPVNRREYVIGPFDLFAQLPTPDIPTVQAAFPAWIESISPNTIISETVALNCALASGVLNRFLGEGTLAPTLSGRMGTKPFSFRIGGQGGERQIAVDGAQIEMDAVYEGEDSVTVFEAKMDLAEDFIVRQLYYPYRHLTSLGFSKRVRTVFLTYSGGVFDLAEYGFKDAEDYNSAHLIRHERHALTDGALSLKELSRMLQRTQARPEPEGIPFPQADTFARVVNLCERLAEGPMTKEDIEEAYGFDPRQVDYYFNAAAYLGLACRESGRASPVILSPEGRRMARMGLARRNAFLAERILRHAAFREVLCMALAGGSLPDRSAIRQVLLRTNPGLGRPDSNTYGRRASTVHHWMQWLLSLAGA